MYFIKTLIMRKLLFILSVTLMIACSENDTAKQHHAGSAAIDFAEAYFNFDYADALTHATHDSKPWVQFVATGITHDDIEILNAREAGAIIELNDCYLVSDTSAIASLSVRDYLLADSLGAPLQHRDADNYTLSVVEHNGQWLVKLTGIPRPQ